MKVNLKNVMIACAALMAGFTSCSNDADTDNTGIIPNGKATVAKITLTQQGSSTRAVTQTPTDAEKEIKTAALYIFNANKTFVKKEDFVVTPLPTNTATATVELTTGTHYFYALVNYPGTTPDFPVNTTLAAATAHTNNLIALADMSTITTGTTGFLMSSIGEPVAKDLIESTEATAGANNPVVLKVGRAMAKLATNFTAAAASEQPITGTLGSVKYQGANNPKAMFALPNYVVGQLQAPYFADVTVDQSKYFPTLPNDLTPMTGWVDADGDEDKAVYVAENSNQTPKEGNSTFVLLKGVFSPKADYCYDKDYNKLSSAIATGNSFWCATTDDGSVVHKKVFFDAVPTTTALEDLTADLNDGNVYTKTIEYKNGESYYPFFLQDVMQANRVAKFTTARNNYYGVTITSVNDLGSNTPGGVIKPETPLGAEAWVHGTIDILNWTVIEQSGGI